MAVPLLCIAALLSAAAADTKHNPLKISQPFLAGSTDPTSGSTAWALTSHGISEKLFTVDKDGVIVPQLAASVRKLDKFTWEVTLKSGRKFSDGTPVTAAKVADALTQLNQVNNGAQASLGAMTMTTVDDLKLKIKSERATPVMNAVLAEWPFAIFMKVGGNFIFTGPYKVETFVKDNRIELIPNTHYPRAAERPLLVIHKKSDGASALKAGELDMAFHIPVGELSDLRATEGITVKSFPVGYQYMMWHNTRRMALSDVKVRKAVDVVLDRSELTQEVRGGQATRSFFPKGTPYYLNDGELHTQKGEADRLLDEAGWIKQGADYWRQKDGVTLTLELVAYPQRPGLVTIQPVIKDRLENVGIKVKAIKTSSNNWDQLDKIIADKDFDLLMWAQHTMPAGDPQWFLNNFFRSDSGSNHAGLASSSIDGLIDDVSHAEMGSSRKQATETAHKAILDQVPVSILMTPSWHVGLGSRLADYTPWGSDYYVIHADFGMKSTGMSSTSSGSSTSGSTSGSGSDTDGATRVMLSGLPVAGLMLLASLL